MNILGFTFASAGLLMLSEFAPSTAIVIGAVMVAGYSLHNPASLQNLSSLIAGKLVTK